MAKSCFLLSLMIGSFLTAFSQQADKPPLGMSQLNKWPLIEAPAISNDGNYTAFIVREMPSNKRTLIVESTDRSWRIQAPAIDYSSQSLFTEDSKQIIFKVGNELHFQTLSTSECKIISDVQSYSFPRSGKGEWISYLRKSDSELVLLRTKSGLEKKFQSVTEYRFDKEGRALVFVQAAKGNMAYVSLPESVCSTIWSDAQHEHVRVSSFNFDETGKKLIFSVKEDSGTTTNNAIWYFESGRSDKAVLKVNNASQGVGPFLTVEGFPEFSSNGAWIFFSLQRREILPLIDSNALGVNVWAYKDSILQPEQVRRLGRSGGVINTDDGLPHYQAVIGIESTKVLRLEGDDERLVPNLRITGDFVVVMDNKSVGDKYWWPYAPQPSFYLESLKDGSRFIIKKQVGLHGLGYFTFSPNGQYLVYWDFAQQSYICYDIPSHLFRNLTKGLNANFVQDSTYSNFPFSEPVAPVAGWFRFDSGLILYSAFDIWKFDPSGKKPPDNLTNGYGERQHIKLRIVPSGMLGYSKTQLRINRGDTLLLSAFDINNKYNGFFYKVFPGNGDPLKVTMGPYTYFRMESQKPNQAAFDNGMEPIRAVNRSCWIVKRQSERDYPNYYFTTDFNHFSALSELHPNSSYNWLSSELVTWKQFDGLITQGIIYKPENFDSSKRYPVIVHFYTQYSHQLYEFPYPRFIGDEINIPWFVSNGYLVFVPDILYSLRDKKQPLQSYESAYNSVVSGVEYLSTFKFVDSKRIGVQGHSFGGGETNYLLTKTKVFAAAAEFAGASDPISDFLSLIPFSSPNIEHFDKLSRTELTLGASPWERPDLFDKISIIRNANKITTPLLITHNITDNQIPWRQGVELYLALRRLGKKVWMLQYDKGRHGIDGVDAVDYTIRLTGFFNYYLKGSQPPRWMTEGVPARMKGNAQGYELDSSNLIP